MKLSDSEWAVMHVLWSNSPATVREVHESVKEETDWAYSTVKTILARLAEKGAVSARKRANTSLYEPRLTQQDARRSAVRSLLDRAFNGTFGSLVHHILDDEKLSSRDRAELREMLDGADRRSPRGRRR